MECVLSCVDVEVTIVLATMPTTSSFAIAGIPDFAELRCAQTLLQRVTLATATHAQFSFWRDYPSPTLPTSLYRRGKSRPHLPHIVSWESREEHQPFRVAGRPCSLVQRSHQTAITRRRHKPEPPHTDGRILLFCNAVLRTSLLLARESSTGHFIKKQKDDSL